MKADCTCGVRLAISCSHHLIRNITLDTDSRVDMRVKTVMESRKSRVQPMNGKSWTFIDNSQHRKLSRHEANEKRGS